MLEFSVLQVGLFRIHPVQNGVTHVAFRRHYLFGLIDRFLTDRCGYDDDPIPVSYQIITTDDGHCANGYRFAQAIIGPSAPQYRLAC